MSFMKSSSPFLYHDATGDIIGIRDADGGETYFMGAVSVKNFGAVGDGVADDTLALQAWAGCGSKLLIWPEGKYLVTPGNAISLNVATYVHGDATLSACIVFPAGVRVITAGTATELIVDTPNADTCAVAIAEDVGGSPSSHSQVRTSIDRFMLRVNGAHGRYGIVTPAKAGLFANKRPRYDLAVHMGSAPGNDDKSIQTYGWAAGIQLGDTVDSVIDASGYGTYNATIVDAGQHEMTGIKVKSVAGAVGVAVRFQFANMRTFFDGSDGLEGFHLFGSEGQGCWEGVVLSNAAGEPGGFIDAVHVNANKCGYKLSSRVSLNLGTVEAYRSDAYHDHGGEWNGIEMTDCSQVSIGSIHAEHGTLLVRTSSSAVKATNSTFTCASYHAEALQDVFKVTNSPDCCVDDGIVNTVATVFNLSGASTNDFSGGVVMPRAGVPVYFVTDGAVDKKRLRFPADSLITVRKQQDITISAAGSTTVKPRETATFYDMIMSAGAGAFTYDLIIDRTAAIPGDVINVKVSGSSSANPTLRICDNSTATVMSTFNSIGGTKRLVCSYIFKESGIWAERSIVDSLEGTY